jgi:hypothetical protein
MLDTMIASGASLASIEAHLDGLPAAERERQAQALDRDAQRRLYELAKDARPLTLGDFVPAAWPDDLPVHHPGMNTLPLPSPLKRFEKRFARPADRADVLFGYNEGLTRGTIGPGYFVAIPTQGGPSPWEERGAVVVDYFRVPDGAVPAAWPRVVPNEAGLSRFVYHHTRDFMRRISRHVTIGAAFKEERALDHYFVLCRQE